MYRVDQSMGISYVRVKMAALRFPGDRRHRVGRGVLFFILISLIVAACATAPEQDPTAPPPSTGIRQYDVALELIAAESIDDRLSIYSAIAASLARDGRVQSAADLLNYSRGLLQNEELSVDQRIRAQARLLAAWQIVASRDETRSELVNGLTRELVNETDAREDASLQADVFRMIFGAQLDNGNAGEAALRRTLDIAYLIDSDSVRSETLVYAAEQVEGRDDRIALNPLAQQAIAAVPALEDSLLAADLNARLAVLSDVLDRRQDVSTLSDRVLRRSQAGLIVDETQSPRLRRIVRSLVGVNRDQDVPQILANVAPQFMRALAFGWYAAALWEAGSSGEAGMSAEAAFEEAYQLAQDIGDAGARAETRAVLIRLRSEYDADYNVEDVAATLLAEARLSSIPSERREVVLSELAVAYTISDRRELVDRLRGLIASRDELARINIRTARALEELGRDEEAVDYLRTVTTMPPPGINDTTAPGLRAARVWQSLEEYDRAISAVLYSTAVDVASILSTIPASHEINPATRGQLGRRVEEAQPDG
ncbi:MAG: hypothetical protein ACOCU4_04760 [Alkalispirochaeta sp.]